MTDGVARELEQAEARLAEARANLESACQSLPYGQWRRSRTFAEGFEAAAIEVGRLRALAFDVEWLAIWMKDRYEPSLNPWAHLPEVVREKWLLEAREIAAAIALAAREEVQG